MPRLLNLTFPLASKSTLHRGGIGQSQPREDGEPGLGRSWDGVKPAFTLQSVSLQSSELCTRTWCSCSRKIHCSQLPS